MFALRWHNAHLRIACDSQYVGIDVSGKIALVKYGKVFRGLKVKGDLSCNSSQYEC